MKEVPTTWDEVKFIDGYPGRYIVLARRHGDKWYIAGVNAQQNILKLKLSLPMFSSDDTLRIYSDNNKLEGNVGNIKVNKRKELTVSIPSNGGLLLFKQ
jgi:hypothetical protein